MRGIKWTTLSAEIAFAIFRRLPPFGRHLHELEFFFPGRKLHVEKKIEASFRRTYDDDDDDDTLYEQTVIWEVSSVQLETGSETLWMDNNSGEII